MDWVATLIEEGRSSGIIRARDLVAKYDVLPGTASVALLRLQRRGVVERVSNGLYINKLAPHFDSRDLINILRPQSYLSLDSALIECGVSNQSPFRLTCVTEERPSTEIRTKSLCISFRKIPQKLFWGFAKRKTRYSSYCIADPEKSLLDWIYFRDLDGLPVELGEFYLEDLNGSRLAEYAKKYPKRILEYFLPDARRYPRKFLDSLFPILFARPLEE